MAALIPLKTCLFVCFINYMQTMSDHNVTPDTMTELSISEIYMYELKTNNAISLCDNTLKKFILQDFCFQNKSLKVS